MSERVRGTKSLTLSRVIDGRQIDHLLHTVQHLRIAIVVIAHMLDQTSLLLGGRGRALKYFSACLRAAKVKHDFDGQRQQRQKRSNRQIIPANIPMSEHFRSNCHLSLVARNTRTDFVRRYDGTRSMFRVRYSMLRMCFDISALSPAGNTIDPTIQSRAQSLPKQKS